MTRQELENHNNILDAQLSEAKAERESLRSQVADLTKRLERAEKALADEWPDLDSLPEFDPQQVAEMNSEHAEWLRARTDAKRAIFIAGATAQRLQDSQRAERFDAWFDLKEPRGKILAEEILAAPLAEYEGDDARGVDP